MAEINIPQNDIKGIPLPKSLSRLFYFNGRFMTAKDMSSEQAALLSRHRLAERAIGPGVSYGLFVSIDIKQQRLSITAGHAADGAGQDLWLLANVSETTSTKTQDLILPNLSTKYADRPLFTKELGAAISPEKFTTAPSSLQGLYLLTATRFQQNGASVEDLGSQCADATLGKCRPGEINEGISLELVFVRDFERGAVFKSELDYIAWGARAYFGMEQELNRTLLNRMTDRNTTDSPTPFVSPRVSTEGTHVPLAAMYFDGGTLKAYDTWTARRMRAGTESAGWLSGLLSPPEPAQLSRLLQFQNQLTRALPAGKSPVPASLWEPSMALTSVEGGTNFLVLPGCGFLPIDSTKDLLPQVETYLKSGTDIVPYRLREASQGELNALFHANLAAGELWAKKYPTGNLPKLLADQKEEINIWYASPRNPAHPSSTYDNYVMFTWPAQREIMANLPKGPVQQDLHLCVAVAGTHPVLDTKTGRLDIEQINAKGRDGEWIGADDGDAPLPLVMGPVKFTLKTAQEITISYIASGALKIVAPMGTKSIKIELEYFAGMPPAPSVPKSTAQAVVDAINADPVAKTLVLAEVATNAMELVDASAGTKLETISNRMNDLLSQVNVELSPMPQNEAVVLSYQTAHKEMGVWKRGFRDTSGVWQEGQWCKAGEWCQGIREVDPDLNPERKNTPLPPVLQRSRLHGISFKLEGPDASKYVVRFSVAAKLTFPGTGKLSEVRNSNFVESAESGAQPIGAAYPNHVDESNPLPIHRIFMQILPRCGPSWPPPPQNEK